MGFLEHFWRNSGKIFRPFFGIFVARPISATRHVSACDVSGFFDSLLCD